MSDGDLLTCRVILLSRAHIRDSLAEAAVARDVLRMAPVRKPVLLRNLFGLACLHPAECLSYTRMLGSLQDAGSTVTLASYLDLLEGAFLVAGLEAWRPGVQARRGSSPKLVVLDNALAAGLREFCKRWPQAEPLIVGSGGVPLDEFLAEDPKERFGG